jgi:hypothetical protein
LPKFGHLFCPVLTNNVATITITGPLLTSKLHYLLP